MWYVDITQENQFHNNANIWQTRAILNFCTSQIHIRNIVIINTDNGCIQQLVMGILNTSTSSQTQVPLMFNFRHGEHHPQNKFFVVRTKIQYPLHNFSKVNFLWKLSLWRHTVLRQ